MEQRTERVYVETERHRISGHLTLARDGYRSRVTDVLNAAERDFVPITDCVVELIGQEGRGTHHDVVARPPVGGAGHTVRVGRLQRID